MTFEPTRRGFFTVMGVSVEKAAWEVPADYPFGEQTVVPLRAGERIAWRFTG